MQRCCKHTNATTTTTSAPFPVIIPLFACTPTANHCASFQQALIRQEGHKCGHHPDSPQGAHHDCTHFADTPSNASANEFASTHDVTMFAALAVVVEEVHGPQSSGHVPHVSPATWLAPLHTPSPHTQQLPWQPTGTEQCISVTPHTPPLEQHSHGAHVVPLLPHDAADGASSAATARATVTHAMRSSVQTRRRWRRCWCVADMPSILYSIVARAYTAAATTSKTETRPVWRCWRPWKSQLLWRFPNSHVCRNVALTIVWRSCLAIALHSSSSKLLQLTTGCLRN